MLMQRLEPRLSTTDIAAIIVEIQSRLDTPAGSRNLTLAIDIKAVDLAATKHTTLLPRWFEDSLSRPWDGEVGWLNAPYTRGLLPQFVEKCVYGGARIVVALLPAAMSVGWFHRFVLPHAVLLFPDKRLGFGSGANTWMYTYSAPFNVVLAIFGQIDEVLTKLDHYISNKTICASLSIPR